MDRLNPIREILECVSYTIGKFHTADTVIGGRIRNFGAGRVHVEMVKIQTLFTRTITVQGSSDTRNLGLRVVIVLVVGFVVLAFCRWIVKILGDYRWLIYALGVVGIVVVLWYLVLRYVIG